MNVTGGVTVEVYRGKPNRFGDKNATLVATVPGCIHQPSTGLNLAYHDGHDFGETSTLTSVLWVPNTADIRDKDRVSFGGNTFRVVGDPVWAGAHPVTGTTFSHKAIQLESAQ